MNVNTQDTIPTKYLKRGLKGLLICLICLISTHVTYAAHQNQLSENDFMARKTGIVQMRISLNVNQESLSSTLHRLAKMANMGLSFQSNMIPDTHVSIHLKKVTLNKALKKVLNNTGLEAIFSDNKRVIIIKPLNKPLKKAETVSGTVKDAKGNTLPGVNVLVKGTSTGTATDTDGHYQITVKSLSDTLIFSYIGYKTKTVPINGRTQINVKLNSQVISGEDIVVVGYGTQKQEDVTASIASADMDQVSSMPVSNPVNALQGQVAGVDIQRSGGQPGEDLSIRIRGRRSINASNDPLIVMDGIPFEGSLSDISSQNIKNIDVLKDAAATAIYGSRGANGVILITTKNGSKSGTQISYSGYYGVTEPMRTADMMNGPEFAAFKRESRRRTVDSNGNEIYSWKGTIPPDQQVFKVKELQGIKNGVSTDWENLVLDMGNRQSHQLSISGGDESTQFMVSGNYLNETALIPTNGFTRYNLRLNLNHQFGDNFRMGASTLLTRSIRDWATNPLGEALRDSPLGKPYDENGNLVFLPVSDGLRSNPLFNLKPGAVEDTRRFNKIFASIFAELDLLRNLTYRVNFGPDYTSRRRGTFLASMTNQRRGAPPTAGMENSNTFSYTLENTLNYNTTFGQNHNFKATLLQSIQRYEYENGNIDVRGLPYESQKFYNVGTASDILGVGSNLSKWQLASFMGRVNYDYKGKYLLQVSGRADGSSRLAKGNKWAFFPGASVGWRIIEEPFMQDTDILTDLKLRASYGVVGNTSISPYQTKGRLARTTYEYGGTPAYGYRLNEIPNRQLSWEKTATFDTGLDFSLLNDRISGSIDYYVAHTTDLLLNRQLPYTSGYNQILQNVGATKNTGIELALNTVNINSPGGFTWSTNLNWSHNTEKILQLFNKNKDDVGNEWFIGYPINVFYDYQKIGIWQKNEEAKAAKYNQKPGEIKVKDQNGDGKINGDDRVILGSDVPNWIAGMTNKFAYKGFDLSVMLNARVGQMLRSRFHDAYNTLFGRYNNLNVDYWTPDNPTNAYPRPNQNQEHPVYSSTMSYFDGSFVKVKNITLGYNVPSHSLRNLGLGRFRIYATIENAYVFSKYKAYDPESSGDVSSTIPTPRLYSFGINLGF